MPSILYFTVSTSSTNNIYFNLYKFSKLYKSKKKRRKFSDFSLFANNTYIQLFYDGFRNSYAHWSMMGWMLLIPMASTSFNLFRISLKKFLIFKALNIFLIFSLIVTLSFHAQTGFLTKSYAKRYLSGTILGSFLIEPIAETICAN